MTRPAVCSSTRDGEPCIRTTPHRSLDQHRDRNSRHWYYGGDMQRGMPRRYIHDHTPLIALIETETRST